MRLRSYYAPMNGQEKATRQAWIDHMVNTNPFGAMKVLSNSGFNGFMQPQDREELGDAIDLYIEDNGEKAVREFMQVTPEYEAFTEIEKPKPKGDPNDMYFRNVAGTFTDQLTVTLKKMDNTLKLVLIAGLIIYLLKE